MLKIHIPCTVMKLEWATEREKQNEGKGMCVWRRDWWGLLESHSPYLKDLNAASWRKALIEIHGLAPIALWSEQTSETDTQPASDRFQLKQHLQEHGRKSGGRWVRDGWGRVFVSVWWACHFSARKEYLWHTSSFIQVWNLRFFCNQMSLVWCSFPGFQC